MSVTFALGTQDGNRTLLACTMPHNTCVAPNDPEHRDDQAQFNTCECSVDQKAACDMCGMEVNVSNANATALLSRLGYPTDVLVGAASGPEFLGRAMVMGVGSDDTGTDSTRRTGPNGATLVDCAIRPGYYTSTQTRLSDLGTYANTRGLVVMWG